MARRRQHRRAAVKKHREEPEKQRGVATEFLALIPAAKNSLGNAIV
jgi:hypothetical protein